ncbi:MAG TPA: metallophosphoesterase family protein [Polyangiaceae bacterium]
MRLAVIADLHANLQALDAVAAEIERSAVDGVLCLGDLVGYHANPVETIRRVRELATDVIAGNHDREASSATTPSGNPGGTTAPARAALDWTRARLGAAELDYLAALPSHLIRPGSWVAVHGCYLNEVHVTGYVTETMLEENLRVVAEKPELPKLAFCGHTHVPMLGVLELDAVRSTRLDATFRWPVSARAVLVNPGSVGQPRDGDVRAAFVIVDLEERTVTPFRVAYDVERAARAVEAAGLPRVFAERLRAGR